MARWCVLGIEEGQEAHCRVLSVSLVEAMPEGPGGFILGMWGLDGGCAEVSHCSVPALPRNSSP